MKKRVRFVLFLFLSFHSFISGNCCKTQAKATTEQKLLQEAMSFQDFESGRSASPVQKEFLNGRLNSSQAVAAGIFQINTSVATFKRLVNTLGTPKDTPELREKLHKIRQHIGNLAKETSEKLKATSESDRGTEVGASKKIADAKLAKDFQAVLREFQKSQRLAADRETTYSPLIPSTISPSSYIASESNLTTPEEKQAQEQRALLAEQRRHEVIELENEVVFNKALVEEREQGIKEIQQQIGEVNEIFKDLAVLVHEQGIVIENIDSNIESVHSATLQANRQLSRASQSQKSYLSLVCLFLVVFGVVLLIIIIILAA